MGALNPGESAPRSCTGSVLQLGAIVALADGVFAEFQRDGLNVNPFASCCMRECCSDILTGFILRDRTAQFLDKSFGRDRERRSSAGAVRPTGAASRCHPLLDAAERRAGQRETRPRNP